MMPQFTEAQIAPLSPDALARVQDLEKKLGGVCIVAYQQTVTPAPLTPDQLKLLQQTEKDIGACLVAYRMA